jgi:hypothetical protein
MTFLYKSHIGYYLESEILKKLQLYSDIVYTEKELIKKYGYKASSIDFLIIYKDQYIFIQTKWRRTHRREDHGINNFINSVEYLNKIICPDKLSFGIWSSRVEPYDDNKIKLSDNNIYFVNSFEDISSLVDKTETFLRLKLGIQ